MKQNLSFKHILTVAVCALSVASCSLDYEPKTGPSSGNFPANITEAEYGLYAAYKSLSTFDASSVAWWKVADNITDIGVTRVNTAKFTELVTSAATGENAVSVKIYNTIYNVVSRINLVLDGLGNLEGLPRTLQPCATSCFACVPSATTWDASTMATCPTSTIRSHSPTTSIRALRAKK